MLRHAIMIFCLACSIFIGNSLLANDDGSDDVEQQLREKLAATGDDPYIMHRLGSHLYTKGDVLAARKLWDAAAQAEPNLAGGDICVAMRLLAENQPKAAEAALDAAENKQAQNPHLFLARADLAIRNRDAAAAEAAVMQALELSPRLWVTHAAMGRLQQRKNDFTAAAMFFHNGTKLAPERPDCWVLLAALQFQQDEVSDALQSLSQAEKSDADQPLAETRLAGMFLAVNDLIGARQWYAAAVSRHPEAAPLRLALARVCMRLKNWAEARAQLTAVLELHEDPTALLLRSEVAEQEREYSVAEEMYRRMLKLQPENVAANNNLAMVLIKQGKQPAEALQYAEKALQGADQHPTVISTQGIAQFEAGQTEAAAKTLKLAIRRSPSDAWARYAYGKLLCTSGQAEAGRIHLEGCLLLDPLFPRQAEVRKLLKSSNVQARGPKTVTDVNYRRK